MKVLKNDWYVFVILILMIIISIGFILNFNTKRIIKLDEVKLKENVVNNNFALMIEEDGEYVESDKFPTSDYILNEELSGCVDSNGNTLENSLTYTNGAINLKTRTNAMCYLYFDEDNRATTYLINNVSSDMLWSSILEEDGYRYVGTNPDNYICFGTTDKSECISDTDKYMYRIIGIFEGTDGKQHLKLIKKEALNASYKWNTDYKNDVSWENSDLYKGINGSYFLTNTTYSYMQNSTWLNKIETWNYTATNTKTYEISGVDYYYFSLVIRETYLHEMNRSSKTNSVGEWEKLIGKISLMYISDYQLSLGEDVLDYINNDSTHYQSMKTGWMHISNNDIGTISQYEWTMTRYGLHSNTNYNAFIIYPEGIASSTGVGRENVVARPVFYLISDIEVSGIGTIENPYIITN